MQLGEKAKEGVSAVRKIVDETILDDQRSRVPPVCACARAPAGYQERVPLTRRRCWRCDYSPPRPQHLVKQLVEMGFDAEHAQTALATSDNSFKHALAKLRQGDVSPTGRVRVARCWCTDRSAELAHPPERALRSGTEFPEVAAKLDAEEAAERRASPAASASSKTAAPPKAASAGPAQPRSTPAAPAARTVACDAVG